MSNRRAPQASRRGHAVRQIASPFLAGVVLVSAVLGLGCAERSADPAPAQAPQGSAAAGRSGNDAEALLTDSAKASYGIGYNVASNVQGDLQDTLDADAFRLGVDDALAVRGMRLPEAEFTEAFKALEDARESALADTAEQNLDAGERFLAENAGRDGIVTLPSGLQYQILVAGNGARPAADDRVTTHYHGTLVDGTVFDSSVERGEPATFPVRGVIPGWVEALQLMPTGSKWRLFVPSELAYGERGAGGKIGPNQVLIFDVELLSIDAG